MTDPTLIVMAAGIGSRYGGLKQIEPVGPGGELIIDYAIYDALRAGFARVVFIIRQDIEETFRDRIGRRVEQCVDTAYVCQELGDVPAGFTVPADRRKPWGTGHAVWCARNQVRTPFAAINADDFYGPSAYRSVAGHLRQAQDRAGACDYCMVGYAIGNTLSEHGYVSRGVCEVTPDGYLVNVCERTRIERHGDGIRCTENGADWVPLADDSTVSMNIWGFTASVFAELEIRFSRFLQQNAAELPRAEFFLPNVVGDMVREGKARVRVLPTAERWFGVTYREDLPLVQAAIRKLVREGIYPERLWESMP